MIGREYAGMATTLQIAAVGPGVIPSEMPAALPLGIRLRAC